MSAERILGVDPGTRATGWGVVERRPADGGLRMVAYGTLRPPVKATPSARLAFGAAYFLNEYRDLVDFDFDRFLHVNRARVRSQGVEMTARWQPHETLWLAGEVTFIDAEDQSEDAVPLLYQPRWLDGARLTWQPTPGLRLRLEARAVASYLDNQIPVPGRDTVPGYGLLGFAGSWRFHRGWSVRARIDNLADRSYETLVGFPGPERAVWVGLGWDRR